MFAMAMDASGDRTRAPESPRSRARLGADRNDVRTDHRPLSDARDVRLSHPSPATPACGGSRGSGAGPGVRAYRASQRSNPYLRPHVLSTLEPADVSARGPPVWIPAPRFRGGRHCAGMTPTPAGVQGRTETMFVLTMDRYRMLSTSA
jgi:hypothetical protein